MRKSSFIFLVKKNCNNNMYINFFDINRIFINLIIFLTFFPVQRFSLLSGQDTVDSKFTIRNKRYDVKKYYEFLTFQSEFEAEVNLPYSNCGREFPALPGDFPCSFLMDEYADTSNGISEKKDNSVSIRIAKTKWSGGKMYEVSSGEADEFRMRLFYDNKKYIKCYTYNDYLVVFYWKGVSEKTLMEIQVLKIRNNMISDIKRINYNEK